jgi:hypothetical protein
MSERATRAAGGRIQVSAPTCDEEDRQAPRRVASGALAQPVALVLAPSCRVWDVGCSAFAEHRRKRVAQPDGFYAIAEVVEVAAEQLLDRCDLDSGPVHKPEYEFETAKRTV